MRVDFVLLVFSEKKKNRKYLMSFIVELACVTLAMTSPLQFYTTLWHSPSTLECDLSNK